jgi:hypothetical protein
LPFQLAIFGFAIFQFAFFNLQFALTSPFAPSEDFARGSTFFRLSPSTSSSTMLAQFLFSAKPDVAPVLTAARAKGRLDDALRQAGLSMTAGSFFTVRTGESSEAVAVTPDPDGLSANGNFHRGPARPRAKKAAAACP